MTKINPWYDPTKVSISEREKYYRDLVKSGTNPHEVVTEIEKEIMEVERAAFRDGQHKDLFNRSEELRSLSRGVWNWVKFGLDQS